MDKIRLEQALKTLPVGPLRYFERIPSTNVEAGRWADEAALDLALVIANEQTAGRGRQGRSWLTPPDAALAFSVLLRSQEAPHYTETIETTLHPSTYELEFAARADLANNLDVPARLARLTALGALAVAQALEKLYGLNPQIKWPNDVLLERRKVCGILSEAHWQGEWLSAVILGIGVNVTPASVPPDGDVIYPATSVEDVLGRPVDRVELLHAILDALIFWRGQIEAPAFWNAWEQRMAFKGETVRVYSGTDTNGKPDEEGELLGMNDAGCLRLRTRSGEERVLCTGEVRLRPTA